MEDFFVSAVAFLAVIGLLWLITRKDKKVSKQWSQPAGLLMRAAVLIAIFHTIFVACGISVLKGYVILMVFVALSLPGIYIDLFGVLFLVIAWLFYEWVFWFPSKKQIVLSHTLVETDRAPKEVQAKRGVAISDLNPIGAVEIDGQSFEARASHGYILKGDQIEIEREDGFELRVRKISAN